MPELSTDEHRAVAGLLAARDGCSSCTALLGARGAPTPGISPAVTCAIAKQQRGL